MPRATASAEPVGRAVLSAPPLAVAGARGRGEALNGAKRLECVRLAGAFEWPNAPQSGGKPRALQTLHAVRWRSGFTLIELMLVMAILTMAVSVTAPALSNFFRGRALDAEARRLLSLARGGQSRAVAEGVPVDLWLDAKQGKYGLQIEPSYETSDPKAVELSLDSGLQIEVASPNPAAAARTQTPSTGRLASTASIPKVALVHPELPSIRFLPDGSISESSPEKLRLVGHDGASLWLVQNSEHLAYEIRTTDK